VGLRRCVKTFVPEPLSEKIHSANRSAAAARWAAMDYDAIVAAAAKLTSTVKAGSTVEIAPDGTIRILAAQALGEKEEAEPPQPPQPEPEAAPATVEGPPPAPDSDSEWSEDPVPDDDETAPYHDRPPAENDDVSLSPTEIEAPAPGEEDDAPPAPAPAPGQLADPAPPTEDPDQEAGAKRWGRRHASTIDGPKGANALLAKGKKVRLTSAKINVLREARRLWPSSNQQDSVVTIICQTAKINVIKEALALGIDENHITCTSVDPAVAEEATGLLGRKIEPWPRTGSRSCKRARSGPDKEGRSFKNRCKDDEFLLYHRVALAACQKKLADWDLVHVQTYKEKLETVYPDGIPSGEPYADLRARYAEVVRLLAPP
jgi:hypothetical protein